MLLYCNIITSIDTVAINIQVRPAVNSVALVIVYYRNTVHNSAQ